MSRINIQSSRGTVDLRPIGTGRKGDQGGPGPSGGPVPDMTGVPAGKTVLSLGSNAAGWFDPSYVDVDRLVSQLGNDTDAWEAALAAGRAIFAGRVGSYSISRQLNLTGNHRVWGRASKTGTKLTATAGFTGSAVLNIAGDHVSVGHLMIDATAAPAVDCLRVTSGYEAHVAHVKTTGGNIGFNLYSNGLESRFEYCVANNAAGAGFNINNVPDAFLLNCSTDGCQYGLKTTGGSFTAFHFHAIKSTKTGIYMIGPSYSQLFGCHSDTSKENGIYTYGATGLTMSNCWAFKSGSNPDLSANPGTWYSYVMSGGDSGIINTVLTGCISSAETNVASSWIMVEPAAGKIQTLTLTGASGDTKNLTGTTSGVTFAGCTGTLAKLNNVKRQRRVNISLTTLAATTFDYDIGYVPAITSNFKPFRVTFTGRGRSEKVAVVGEMYLSTSNDTTGAGVGAKSYFMGASTNEGAKFTLSATRTNAVLTFTITSTSTETIDLGFEVEPLLEAKPS